MHYELKGIISVQKENILMMTTYRTDRQIFKHQNKFVLKFK